MKLLNGECSACELDVLLKRCWESEELQSCVKGRLHNRLEYWESVVQAPPTIISIIEQGYILPFVSEPDNKFFKNQKSALEQEFVSQSVADLLSNGCVK